MSRLVEHARTELEIVGEDEETIEWFISVIEAFNKLGHSGSSAAIAIPRLTALLRFQNLTPLTNNPEEWVEVDSGGPGKLWQSRRNPEAFSVDEGKYFRLVGNDRITYKSKDVN